MSKPKTLDWQEQAANSKYIEDREFIYYRAGRLDGRGGSYSVEELDKAINHAESHRAIDSKSTPEQIQEYNVWTSVKNYLLFMKHKLPTDS